MTDAAYYEKWLSYFASHPEKAAGKEKWIAAAKEKISALNVPTKTPLHKPKKKLLEQVAERDYVLCVKDIALTAVRAFNKAFENTPTWSYEVTYANGIAKFKLAFVNETDLSWTAKPGDDATFLAAKDVEAIKALTHSVIKQHKPKSLSVEAAGMYGIAVSFEAKAEMQFEPVRGGKACRK